MCKGKVIEIEDLKRIQLDILIDIDEFCRRNEIRYSLAYGTLLGAVRHGGYIPWDDDIDICMPRPDYERFVSSYNNHLYKCYSHNYVYEYLLPFAKVADERTIMDEKMYQKDVFGVYVDVFPVDGYQSKWQIIVSRWLTRFLNTKKAILDGKRSFVKNAIMRIGKIVLLPFSINDILKWQEFVSTNIDFNTSLECEIFCSSTVEREIVPSSFFKEYCMVSFEGHSFKAVREYNRYLNALYGDYMQLPPVEKRVAHHIFNAWWKE